MLVIWPPLVRFLLRSLIFSWVIFLLWFLSILCIFWVTILCQTRLVKIFSPSVWLVFSFSWQCLSYSRRFYFNEVQLINYFSHELCLWFAPKKSLPHLRSSSVQLLSRVWLFVTPRTAARQTSLSITPGLPVHQARLPVHRQLPEFTQTQVHWVGDAIQPSHPLSSPSPPDFYLFQHQGLFKWVSSLHQVAKVLEFQLQHQSFQWIFRTDLF